MIRRLRRAVTIEKDFVSPDSIAAAQEFLLRALEEMAEQVRVAVDWNTYHVYTRRTWAGHHRLIVWAEVLT